MNTDTTRRTPAVSTQDVIRSIRNALACLYLKKINGISYSQSDKQESNRLHKRLAELEQEETNAKYGGRS